MPHTQVIEQLKASLQTAYRQAIDADTRLDALKKAGHVKFNTIFTKDEGFSTSSNRFQPYVQELAAEIDAMSREPDTMENLLEGYVRKLGLLLQTMQTFKANTK
ncbi:prephenate dehydrogenase [Shewanella abyssi]|uniref:prephenate dehydrogenase n=1 Tax=Shewanella abyssi TaxID=311789 RepID=UPI00200BB86F|nr:prephenate dehydrogenase [Shewanella abyssi]MCL1050105.1 prephenate dehydrogenase [Shewanella abyssi]